MNIGTWLNNRLFCKKVGEDEFGNKYFVSRFKNADGKYTRSVVYNGINEATKIPPVWHGWMHYTHDEVPTSLNSNKYSWQKPHLPNLTGTKFAYFPSGHALRGGKRAKATGDYEPWKPN